MYSWPVFGSLSGVMFIAEMVLVFWPRPNYWMIAFGAMCLLFVLLIWFCCWWSEWTFEKDVDVSSRIFRCSASERAELSEPHPKYHPNSGIRRWKKGVSR